MSLESKTIKTVLQRMYEAATDMVQEYKTNPDYWANNKRKMHGIPMRRKPSKIKTKTYWYRKHQKQFFNMIEFAIDETIGGITPKFYNDFVDIKDFECGDKNNGNISVRQRHNKKYPDFRSSSTVFDRS